MCSWEQRLQGSQQEVSDLRQQLSECQQQLGFATAERDDAHTQLKVTVSQEVHAAEQQKMADLRTALDKAQVSC